MFLMTLSAASQALLQPVQGTERLFKATQQKMKWPDIEMNSGCLCSHCLATELPCKGFDLLRQHLGFYCDSAEHPFV